MTTKNLAKHYDDAFYEDQVSGSVRSAKIILEILYDFFQPRSVVDVGCGRGTWLSVAESLGSEMLTGIDGHWNTKDALLSNNINFIQADLEGHIDIKEKYELCISLEVAEHLSEQRAHTFVDTLCKASNVVLFSAATVNQGGENHINEQWQSYWVRLFQSNGYKCYDVFRQAVWENEEVAWWYRQNLFLFLNLPEVEDDFDIEKLKRMEKTIPDIVHPKSYEIIYLRYKKNEEKVRRHEQLMCNPTFQLCINNIKKYFINKFGKVKP